ncbi:uncharacterized protein QC763_709240 [Podospora pseudopauciseta]|uniref:Uncharacterized protein n=1 Tax=Podospora pseudopauciseta TaxID=2093780 RepID=A0ABR0H1Q1_9PEZI|nr:hypothetical protein QC763_709240 [Podospora pseudopauciseta]
MPVYKKDRKNGKEGGGVVAAVTKQGAKFTNGNGTGTTKGSSSASPVISPEIKPASVSSNENPVASPLLDAASTASYATSTSLNTREWTRGISAGMAGSPGNLISLAGESPPTAPSSYEDPRGIPSGWSSPRPSVGYHPPSASPPLAGRRPLSFHVDNNYYSPPDTHSHLGSIAAARRGSMHSNYAHRAVSNPPLPHQPQAHFYGAPEIDLDSQSHSGMKAGEKGYYCGFDTLPLPNTDPASSKSNVVLAGYEGGLEILTVGKREVETVANLKGLRGGVYHAKILPWMTHESDLFPLVAVVIHGPNLPAPAPAINVEGDYDAVSAERSEAMTNITSPDPSSKESVTGSRPAPGFAESYYTSVEVYSLKTGRPVSVLLEAPKVPLKMPITSAAFKAPPPTGAFHIHAEGGSIVVSSGVTGECWIYRQAPVVADQPLHFRCHGKVWTTLQQPLKGEPGQENERGRSPVPPRPRPQVAIVSVSSRWMAYCPATPSSQIALRASVPVLIHGRAPGLTSVTPPQLPQANADLDLPLSESVVNKLMRDATQELIQGAKWVGKQGLQAWNNYWNPQPSQTPRSPTQAPQNWGLGASPPQFPPTHGAVTPPVSKEPGLVSVLDIDSLGPSSNLHPVTTFTIPHGCSFLSLSPSGLFLFSASSKGDVQTVWDLMRVQNTKSSPLQATGSPVGGPRVRQVAQFSRMTVARIVELAWTQPHGERAAMVTERGTVHLLDLPSGAFSWPPPRRRLPEETKAAVPEGSTSAVSMATNALSSVREAARPLINRQRRSNSNTPAFAGAAEYAAHGGKVIVHGISHSLGKTGNAISQLRHTGDNRVSLPNSSVLPEPGCVAWVAKRDRSLSVLGGGQVRVFQSKRSGAHGKRGQRLSRYTDHQLPLLPDDSIAPAVKRILDPDEYLDFSERDLDPFNNTLVLNQIKPSLRARYGGVESSIPQAEIESSAPYQPFHTDRRIALYEMTSSSKAKSLEITSILAETQLEDTQAEPSAPRKKKGKAARATPLPFEEAAADEAAAADENDADDTWVFGLPISATKIDLGLPHLPEDESFNIDLEASRALPASAMERVLFRGDDDTQIVITTRRRRGAGGSGNGEDGFFEDDCEVLDFADQRV